MRTLAVAMLVAVPAVAGAEIWRGTTGQGRAVAVRTGDDDRVDRVRVSWKAKCRKGSYMSRTVFRRPFDVSEAAVFEADHGSPRRAKPSAGERHRRGGK